MLSSQVTLCRSFQLKTLALHNPFALPTSPFSWLLQGSVASQKAETDSSSQETTVERQPSAVVVKLDPEEEV